MASNDRVRLHLRVGWLAVLLFLSLGLVLETLHLFKLPWYTDAANDTRRTMWTLSHAHGTLLGVLNIGFAFSLTLLPAWTNGRARFASKAVLGATILLPLGFLLGGVVQYGGDPGLGVMLVPVGAGLLFISVLLTYLATR